MSWISPDAPITQVNLRSTLLVHLGAVVSKLFAGVGGCGFGPLECQEMLPLASDPTIAAIRDDFW